MPFESRMRTLLAETPEQTRDRCLAEWLRLAGSDTPPIVLFGAGNLGRKVARAMAGSGWRVVGFADNDSRKWGSEIESLPVYSPLDALQIAGPSACFIVTIWQGLGSHRYMETRGQLLDLGAGHVAHAGHLGWRLPERIFPYYSMDHPIPMLASKDQIFQALKRWDDSLSRDLFCRLVLWRLTLDFELLPEPDGRAEYFAPDLMPPRSGEIFIDGGAFDGDTTELFLSQWGEKAAGVHAFEPDPANIRAFQERFEQHPERAKVVLHPMALAAHEGDLAFDAEGTFASSATPKGKARVPCSSLDVLFKDLPFTFLKLDVEGGEMDALRGGRTVLGACSPRLAICVYHTQGHLWEVPNLVDSVFPAGLPDF